MPSAVSASSKKATFKKYNKVISNLRVLAPFLPFVIGTTGLVWVFLVKVSL